MEETDRTTIIEAMRRWIKTVVVEHTLCPFAQHVYDRIRFEVTFEQDVEAVLLTAQRELEHLINSSPENVPTSILLMPNALSTFDDYLWALDLLNAGLDAAKLTGEIQVASFHPHYQFADTASDDPANWTNRSPVPAFHFLREHDVEEARTRYPDPEMIPLRNIDHFRRLGGEVVAQMLRDCWLDDSPETD